MYSTEKERMARSNESTYSETRKTSYEKMIDLMALSNHLEFQYVCITTYCFMYMFVLDKQTLQNLILFNL